MPTRFAIIGCGAVAHAHLPVLAATAGAETTVLVDRDGERARTLAEKQGVPHWAENVEDVVGKADAAIVALPHHLHAPVTLQLLELGLHVMVEKPMALTTAECDAMIATAEDSQRVLSVALISRLLGIGGYVKAMLDGGMLGAVKRFEVSEGSVYAWPVASDFMFKREAGGGVLADSGAHVLDVLQWWLGDFAKVEYFDDAAGGAEADCTLNLELASGATGTVTLSRTRDLGNTWRIEGEQGTLEVERAFGARYRWRRAGTDVEVSGKIQQDGKDEDPLNCFHLHLADFLEAVATGREPLLSGREARRTVALIERCHAERKPLVHPWEAWAEARTPA